MNKYGKLASQAYLGVGAADGLLGVVLEKVGGEPGVIGCREGWVERGETIVAVGRKHRRRSKAATHHSTGLGGLSLTRADMPSSSRGTTVWSR